MPFAGSEQHQIVCIMSGMYDMEDEEWKGVSSCAKDFVKKLLVVDVGERMSAEEALGHRWIQEREQLNCKRKVDRSVVDALRRFEHASKFRRACLSVMAWSLTHEERKSVVDAFLELDTSRRGTIRLHELRDVLSRFDIPDQESAEIFHALDRCHCDEVHYSEFLGAMVSSRIAMHDQMLRAAFARFDVDGKGYISRDSLTTMLGDGDVDELLEEVDPKSTGKVSYEQFVAYLRSGNAQEEHMDVVNQVIDDLKREDDAAKRRRID
eukprot:symbB.v1.2.033415.t1/scaffold4142.1/size43930/4